MKDVFHLSILVMGSGRHDRWRDKERDPLFAKIVGGMGRESMVATAWLNGGLSHMGNNMGKFTIFQESDTLIQQTKKVMTNAEIANGTLFGGPMTNRLMHCMRSGGTPTKKLTYLWTKGLHIDLSMLRKRGMWTIIGYGDQTPPTAEVEEILTTKLLLQTSKSLQFHMSGDVEKILHQPFLLAVVGLALWGALPTRMVVNSQLHGPVLEKDESGDGVPHSLKYSRIKLIDISSAQQVSKDGILY
ncbi:hypothetical protein ACS0TY_034599 [Phlomoides rotata]